MTETDNPQVKEHLGDPKKSGQCLKRIEELDDNTREFQPMFESREIKPVVLMGRYNLLKKTYELNEFDLTTLSASSITAGAATQDHVITAGQTWAIYGFTAKDDTRASTALCCISYDGGTTVYKAPLSYQDVATTQGYGAAAMFPKPFIMVGSSTNVLVRIFYGSYQAGDTVKSLVFYRRLDG